MPRFFGPSTSLASQSSLDIIKEIDGDDELACCRRSTRCRHGGRGARGGPAAATMESVGRLQRAGRCSGSSWSDARNRDEYEDLSNIDDAPLPCQSDGADGDIRQPQENEAEDTASGGRTKGAQGWRNVRAVMAYYCTLRKIKRDVVLRVCFSFPREDFVCLCVWFCAWCEYLSIGNGICPGCKFNHIFVNVFPRINHRLYIYTRNVSSLHAPSYFRVSIVI